jgi:hypothetical protein
MRNNFMRPFFRCLLRRFCIGGFLLGPSYSVIGCLGRSIAAGSRVFGRFFCGIPGSLSRCRLFDRLGDSILGGLDLGGKPGAVLG